MIPQEKTTLVVQTIFDELKGQQSGHLELNIANNDSLNGKIFKTELDDILKNLQDKEHILEILTDQPNKEIIAQIKTDAKTGKKTVVPLMNVPPVMPTKKDYDFEIHVSPKFENWYSAYQKRIKQKIEDLSEENFHKLSELTTLINNRFQMQGTPENKFYSNTNYEDSLKFLNNKSVLQEYNVSDGKGWATFKIQLTLNVDRFTDFYSQIQKIQKQKFSSKPVLGTMKKDPIKAPFKASSNASKKNNPNGEEILYEIKINMRNEIKLNNKTLSRPNAYSINSDLFAHLYKHPDKLFKKSELKDSNDNPIKKDLHKILNELGFTKDYKKVFFSATKDKILFRKNITRADFEKMKIPPLKV